MLKYHFCRVLGILSHQAGDMLNLRTFIIKAVNSAFSVTWTEGNLNNNKKILLHDINDFYI